MAIRKVCDHDGEDLGLNQEPFIQFQGSISEQIEGEGPTEFRYLTDYNQRKMAFCNTSCVVGWIEVQRTKHSFQRQAHTGQSDEGEFVIHT